MFENAHLIRDIHNIPYTNYNDLYFSHKTNQTDTNDILVEEQLFKQYLFFEKCTFSIDGFSDFCPSRPITEFAKNNLYYIQTFALMTSGPLYFTRRHDAQSFLLLYTYSGKGYLEYNEKTYHLQEGDGIFIDCRNPHFYRTEGTQWVHSVLHFNGALCEYFFSEFSKNGSVLFHQPIAGSYQNQLEHLIDLQEDVLPYRELLISHQLENILIDLLVNSQQYEKDMQTLPKNIKYLVHYINNHYYKHLTLDFLAEFSNISKYQLCRLFRKYLGLSPNEYIIQLRLENAKKLLDSSSLSAKQISAMVGIQDENYFYRLFKSRIGMTPDVYRKRK